MKILLVSLRFVHPPGFLRVESFQLTLDLGMDTVCEKDWGAPDPISEEGIDNVSNLLRSGRLFRFCKKEKQKAHNLLVKFSSVSATV